MGDEYRCVGLAARLLGVHPQTWRRWEREGKIASTRVNQRGDQRYARTDLIGLLDGSDAAEVRRIAVYVPVRRTQGQETSVAARGRELRGTSEGGVVVTYTDRALGLNESEQSDPEQELLDDFMVLVASFSGRIYGRRRPAVRRRLLEEAAGATS